MNMHRIADECRLPLARSAPIDTWGAASRMALALACLSGVASTGAQAQTVASPPAAGPPAAVPASQPAPDTSGVGEIVVTAERRSANLQTTPIAIAAISGDQLQQKQIVTLENLQTQTPGLSVTNGGQTTNINIRGLGNTTTSPAVTTGVAIFRDGLYEPEAILLGQPFFDIADVEVLRGPQGTIVGQNSTGGAVQINSRNPNFDGVNGYVEAIAGNYAELRTDGAINLPVNDILAVRIAFNVEHRHSFYTDIGTKLSGGPQSDSDPGKDDGRNLRLGLLFRPSDSFQALFKAELNRYDYGGTPGKPLPAPVCNLAGCTPAASYYQYGYDGPSVYNGNQQLGRFDLDYNHVEEGVETANRFSLELRYKFDDGITLRSLTGFQRNDQLRIDDVDKSAAPYGAALPGQYDYFDVGPHNDYWSQEFNLISPDTGRFTWLLGASYFHKDEPVTITQYPDLPGVQPNPQQTGSDFIFNTTSTQRLGGVYGQGTLAILSTLKLEVGGRYSFDKSTGAGYLIPGTLTGLLPFTVPTVGKYAKNVPTGKVALNWNPIHNQFFYAFVARGYKQGGTPPAAPNFGPEYVNDYEIGWKGSLFGNHLKTQLGGYYMQYKNLQQQVVNTNVGTFQVSNLGDSTIWGIEASAQAKFGRFSADFGFAYNNSKLGAITAVANYKLPGGGSSALGPQCATGQTTGCFDYTPYLVSLSGESNPYAPRITANVNLSYGFPFADGEIRPQANFSYSSKQYASIFQDSDYYLLKPRKLLDLYLTYTHGPWEAQVFAKNVTNQFYLSGISGLNYSFNGDPRTVGVRLERTF